MHMDEITFSYPSTGDHEIDTIQGIHGILRSLDPDERARVVRYFADRFGGDS